MYQDQAFLQGFRQTESIRMDTEVVLDPEQKQQDESEPDTQPESNQGTLEPKNGPLNLDLIESRIKQLRNRNFVLLKMQQRFAKKADNGVGTTEELFSEDRDQCELEAIQKELEELQVKKEQLEKLGKSPKVRAKEAQQDACPPFFKTESPRGGIYMLPPPELIREDVTPEQSVKTKRAAEQGPVVPADSLGETPALTSCPSCEEVVYTETHRKVGETSWLICWFCAMTGLVAGCCLIPFFTRRLKDVQHQCPECQATIHTHQPL